MAPKLNPALLALGACILGSASLKASPGDLSATVDGAAGARLRVEALESGIVRIWVKPAGGFARERSLATQAAPDGRKYLRVTRAPGSVEVDSGALTLHAVPGSLAFTLSADGGPKILDGARIEVAADGSWSLEETLGPSERLMGLGQDNKNNGRLDRRGTVRDLWEGQQIESGNVTAQYPVPLLLSTGRDGHAYGVFFDNVHRMRFDLGHANPDRLRVSADGGEIDLYVIDGPRLSDVISRYTLLTGRPSLPPLWALGYWQSKCTYYDWDALDEAYSQLHARGFPVDVMVIDADWPEVVTDYVWAKRWLETGHGKTPAQKIADYAAKGVRIVMSQSGPMVQQASPTFAPGWAMGVFATDGAGNPVECGYYGGKLLDFTHPRMNDWLWPQTRKLDEAGIAGWWLDLDEPEGEPPQTHYFAGRPAEIHNQYSLLCTLSFEGVQLAVHPDQRPFILSRAGPAGFQAHHGAVWTGDINSDYATLRAHPPEMLNSGLSGFTYWTCDTGGFLTGYYRDDMMGAHARLYERWMQFSAWSPITRAHKAGGAPEPYAYGLATEQGTRHYLQQRYRLLPYIYSYAWEASRTGLPIVRALALEYPDDPGSVAAPGDEYLFGREFLVAPVLHEGLSNRSVYFPPGNWTDWDTGVSYEGGRSWVVAAPQNRIPVAVRAGAIIPMAPDMASTSEKPWDPLTLEVFPHGASEFTLYRDDGISFEYAKADFTVTRFACEATDQSVRFSLSEANKRFTPGRYVLHLHLDREPVAVAIDGAPVAGWTWDPRGRVLGVQVDSGPGLRHEVRVALGAQALAPRPAPALVADPIDPKGETAGSGGRPTPHFFPAPSLPATVKASNYDNGGEGVAFHVAAGVGESHTYRADDIGLAATADAGGGYALRGLAAGDWVRYSVDCGNGGYFDLSVRVAAAGPGSRLRIDALDRTVATVEVPPTGGPDVFRDVVVPGVYLNPGEVSLLVFLQSAGANLNAIHLAPAQGAPGPLAAALAERRGPADLAGRGEAAHPLGYVRNLGRIGSGIAFGIDAGAGGDRALRIRYASNQKVPVALSLQVGSGPQAPLSLGPTGGEWRTVDVPAAFGAGTNRAAILGREDGWNSVQIDLLQVVGR